MNPKNTVLSLTAEATGYLEKMIKSHGAVGIEIALEKAGCAGYMYRIDVCHQQPQETQIVTINPQITLVIPPTSIPRIQGSTLDYQKVNLETKAVFSNPNVTLACGCGESVELIIKNNESADA